MNLLKKPYLIAIDGPAGSGKGTIAKIISKKLNLNYLDSGAIYRVIALGALQEKISLDNVMELLVFIRKVNIEFIDGQTSLNQTNVSERIRSEEVSKAASIIAKHPELRKEILDFQRQFLYGAGLVAEGRDMTTVVFPNADLKIYLDASVEERAKRRYKQLKVKGKDVNITRLTKEIIERDKQDRERKHSPLLISADSIILNTDHLNIDQAAKKILELIVE